MKPIQMVDLKSQYEKIKLQINAGIQEVIDSAVFIKGGKVVEFQHQLEEYLLSSSSFDFIEFSYLGYSTLSPVLATA